MDEADISTFIVPSIVDRDPVVVAIGTEGTAPVLAQGIRAKVDAMLPHSLGELARSAQACANGWPHLSLPEIAAAPSGSHSSLVPPRACS